MRNDRMGRTPGLRAVDCRVVFVFGIAPVGKPEFRRVDRPAIAPKAAASSARPRHSRASRRRRSRAARRCLNPPLVDKTNRKSPRRTVAEANHESSGPSPAQRGRSGGGAGARE